MTAHAAFAFLAWGRNRAPSQWMPESATNKEPGRIVLVSVSIASIIPARP
jgi:hypothetical protein